MSEETRDYWIGQWDMVLFVRDEYNLDITDHPYMSYIKAEIPEIVEDNP